MDQLIVLPHILLQNIDIAWTFLLLIVRFTGLLMVLPGLGMGMAGIPIRMPAIMVFAFAALIASPRADIPSNTIFAIGMITTELIFGLFLGYLPQMIIAGVQTAASIASTSMGLQASQLIDPTIQTPLPDIARIMGDLTVLLFLSLGGHYFVIYAASSMGGIVKPGSLIVSGELIEVMLNHSAEIFEIGVLFSAPVVVALLITNIVLGLISKAVPTVNVFMVSFPLTIAVGLVLSPFLVSELSPFISPWIARLDPSIRTVVELGVN